MEQPLNFREYGLKISKLNQVLDQLTKDYCATECPKYGGTTCCDNEPFKVGTTSQLLLLQEIEAKQNGWDGPGEGCKYHTDNGCLLDNYTSPVCIGYLCHDLKADLRRKHQGNHTNRFITVMNGINDTELNKTHIGLIENLDEAILLGQNIIEENRQS